MSAEQSEKIIVCVDNDRVACDYLCACLTENLTGHARVKSFYDPNEALKFLEKNRAHLVISCIFMPVMDGFKLLKDARRLQPELPFLLITAHPDVEVYLEAARAGAYDFFVKPVSLQELFRAIIRELDLKMTLVQLKSLTTESMVPSKNKVVIFADDDPDVLMSMCIVLERLGYDAVLAENGLEAIQLSKIIAPDIVSLDLDMPVMGGLEALRQFRQQYPRRPVLIISGETEKEVLHACKELGCARVMMKPVPMDELSKALERSLLPGRGRRHVRINSILKVAVNHQGVSQVLYTKSLLQNGVFVRTKHPLPVGSEVEVVLTLDGEKLILRGKVIYFTKIDHNQPGMAIEFVDIPAGAKVRLHKLRPEGDRQ